jgi:hypothetical protein
MLRPQYVTRGCELGKVDGDRQVFLTYDPELPWSLRSALSRICTITTIDMRCNDRSSTELATVKVIDLVAIELHGGYYESY